MITNEELSLSKQARGRKILLSFSFLNGIALTFITGNVLSLYLLKVGCTTPIVAVIASFGYLGTLFAFTGKKVYFKTWCRHDNEIGLDIMRFYSLSPRINTLFKLSGDE